LYLSNEIANNFGYDSIILCVIEIFFAVYKRESRMNFRSEIDCLKFYIIITLFFTFINLISVTQISWVKENLISVELYE